jgi:hypothetical protein
LATRNITTQPLRPNSAPSAAAPAAKWFMAWAWQLGQQHIRLLLAGLQRATGRAEAQQHVIVTAYVGLRDEVQRLCLHAGYASHFRLAKDVACDPPMDNRLLTAHRDLWEVRFFESTSSAHNNDANANDTKDSLCAPVLQGCTDVQATTRSGRTWCITLPSNTAGILVARRALHSTAVGTDGAASVVRQASMPVLAGNCHYRPDVGYVQGMSYLAGNLLLYLAPYEAFVAFAHLLNSPFFHVFLKMDVHGMQARYKLFEECLAEAEPELSRHLAQEGVGSDLYFMEWCMTAFCKRLPLDVVGRVWDCYLLQGELVIYRAAVAILRAHKAEFLSKPFDAIMRKLNQVPLDISEEELMRAFAEVHISSALKAKLRQLNHQPTFLRDD